MRALKTILTIVIVAVLVVGGLIAMNWKRFLSPQQQLQYGMVFEATDAYAAAARANPTDQQALHDYIDVLVRRGNLGRAWYISKLYGVEHPGLADLREAVVKSIEAQDNDEAYAFGADLAVEPYADDPLRQAVRYAEGYNHALLGDWMSAKNYFNAIDAKHLAPELRPFHTYYLARSYRLAGDDAEKVRAEGLYREVIKGKASGLLKARAAYNLIDMAEGEGDTLKLFNEFRGVLAESDWANQMAHVAVARTQFPGVGFMLDNTISAVELGISGPSGKAACLAALDALDAVKPQIKSWERYFKEWTNSDACVLLARGAAEHGFSERVASEYEGIRDPSAPVYEARSLNLDNLNLALAVCYRATGEKTKLAQIADSSATAWSSNEAKSGAIFEYAGLLREQQQWNEALRQYQRVIDIGGEDASRAHLARYEIVKRVQDPLNVSAAITELKQITDRHESSEEYAKAVEELIPLLIFAGRSGDAIALADEAVDWPGGAGIEPRTVGQLAEVGLYWKAYLAGKQNGKGVADAMLADMVTRYWNYYELTTAYPPEFDLATTPMLLEQPESAGEYLAGLGLTWAASEFFDAEDDQESQLLLFHELANGEISKSDASRQWDATELLESGAIREQPLLEYALAEAYPLLYREEIEQAAAKSGVDAALIYAVIKKETNFKPDSVSWAGAQGLMQLMPDTASWLNNRYSLGQDLSRILEPEVNIRLGAAYLRSLQDDLGEHNLRAVVHCYNGGPGNYQRWRSRYPVDQVLFTDLVPNEENETYTKKVIKYYKVYDWLLSR